MVLCPQSVVNLGTTIFEIVRRGLIPCVGTSMIYCEECAKEHDLEETIIQLFDLCELCGVLSQCSSSLVV